MIQENLEVQYDVSGNEHFVWIPGVVGKGESFDMAMQNFQEKFNEFILGAPGKRVEHEY